MQRENNTVALLVIAKEQFVFMQLFFMKMVTKKEKIKRCNSVL